jgi:hypothetical protein
LFGDVRQVSKLQATVMSKLITCKYYIRVNVGYSSICVSETPNIEIPIIIYIPDVRINLEHLKPNMWDPIFMPQCSLDLPSAEQIGITNINPEENLRNN